MKFGQVQKRMAENCCFVWVIYGETFRDATILEAANMRKEHLSISHQPQVLHPPAKDSLSFARHMNLPLHSKANACNQLER
jgi:hypothetical protein